LSGERAGSEPTLSRLADKLNLEKMDLATNKNSSSKSDSGSVSQQPLGSPISAFGQGQAVVVSRLTITDSTPASKNSTASDAASAVRDQIYESIQTSLRQGQRQITIHLNPPELGRVSIKFSEDGKELMGVLDTTNPQTRAEIRQAIPEIIRSLEESGISVKRIDVTLSDLPRQSNQESLRDNTSTDMWEQFGNQNSQDPRNRPLHDSFMASAHIGDTAQMNNDTTLGSNQSSDSDALLDVLL
jgi:flagellar hook-length control protein FliK